MPYFCFASASISNPYKLVWEQGEGSIAGLVRFFADLDMDGTKDLFVGAKSLLGNGGGEFHIFLKELKGYKKLGVIHLNPKSIEFSEKKVFGMRKIKTYWHMSASSGEIIDFAYNGNEFKKVSSKSVNQGGATSLRKPTIVKIEESGKNLTWKP